MRRILAVLAALPLALTVVTGCGGDEASSGGGGGSPTSDNSTQGGEETRTPSRQDSTDPKVIEVTIDGDSVTPNGERVEVATGQDVELDITADVAGEIHVHSTPELELEYQAGTSTVTIPGIEQPGTVDVEVHDPEKVIVQLEVS